MPNKYTLEISVETVDAAMAAERGGAERIEFCSNLKVGGTTPSLERLLTVRERLRMPIFSMVRPRGGEFFYTEPEFAAMRRDVDAAKDAGMDGVVLGLLTEGGRIDVARTKLLVKRARPLPATFHRAFDECTDDLREALEDVIETGATRLLTSGGKRTAPEALDLLGELVRIAGERLIVMPGSGLHAGNIREAVTKTGAREFHAGLSSVASGVAGDIGAFEAEVRRMAGALRDCD
jgi:copper homeostasis protein